MDDAEHNNGFLCMGGRATGEKHGKKPLDKKDLSYSKCKTTHKVPLKVRAPRLVPRYVGRILTTEAKKTKFLN